MGCVFDRWFLVFQSFGQHGRELITSELALRILSILSEEQFLPSMDPASLNGTLDRLVIKVASLLLLEESSLLKFTELQICFSSSSRWCTLFLQKLSAIWSFSLFSRLWHGLQWLAEKTKINNLAFYYAVIKRPRFLLEEYEMYLFSFISMFRWLCCGLNSDI